jgi:hypothetical protein
LDFSRPRIEEIEGALARGETTIKINRDVQINGSALSGEKIIEINQSFLDEYKNLHSAAEYALAILPSYPNLGSMADARAMEPCPVRLERMLSTNYSGENILQWCGSIRHIEHLYMTHLATGSIRIPVMITVALRWLCVFGLVLPLGYLSAHAPSLTLYSL